MGIKGLTDRGMSFPEIGFIRKGMKDKEGKMHDFDYFRVEISEPESQEEFNNAYKDSKGKPKEINIFFPFDDIERNWDAWLEAYTAGRMVARSDGEHMLYWIDTETGEELVNRGIDKQGNKVPNPPFNIVGHYISQGERTKGQKMNILLKPVGRLKVVIPELGRLAYMTVHTTSINDIKNISEQLDALKAINRGRLAGIPLVLRRRPRMISTPDLKDKNKRNRREKWLLSIEARPEWVQQQIAVLSAGSLPKLPSNADIKLLTGKVEELPEIEENEIMEELTDEEMGISDAEYSDLNDLYSSDLEPEPDPEPEQNPMYQNAAVYVNAEGKSYADMTVDELTIVLEKIEEHVKKAGRANKPIQERKAAASFLKNWKINQQQKGE